MQEKETNSSVFSLPLKSLQLLLSGKPLPHWIRNSELNGSQAGCWTSKMECPAIQEALLSWSRKSGIWQEERLTLGEGTMIHDWDLHSTDSWLYNHLRQIHSIPLSCYIPQQTNEMTGTGLWPEMHIRNSRRLFPKCTYYLTFSIQVRAIKNLWGTKSRPSS